MTDLVERLRSHPGPDDSVTEQFRTMVAQRHEAAAEIERLTKEAWETFEANGELAKLTMELRAEIERLRAALQWLMKQPWKSIDKDNMEFQVTVSCYVRDALIDALEPKP